MKQHYEHLSAEERGAIMALTLAYSLEVVSTTAIGV